MPIDIISLFVTVPVVGLTLALVYMIRVSSEPAPADDVPEPSETRTAWEQARTAGYWASSIALAIVYVLTGIPKLTGLNEVMHRFSEWGYPEEFALFIGVSEFLAGLMLLIPGTSLYAAGFLGVIMVGAIYTHLAFDPLAWVLLPAFCLSFLFFIGYEDWQRRRQEA